MYEVIGRWQYLGLKGWLFSIETEPGQLATMTETFLHPLELRGALSLHNCKTMTSYI